MADTCTVGRSLLRTVRCARTRQRDSLGHANYAAAGSGSGSVDIPEPTGTIVDEIDVTPLQGTPVLFVVLGT